MPDARLFPSNKAFTAPLHDKDLMKYFLLHLLSRRERTVKPAKGIEAWLVGDRNVVATDGYAAVTDCGLFLSYRQRERGQRREVGISFRGGEGNGTPPYIRKNECETCNDTTAWYNQFDRDLHGSLTQSIKFSFAISKIAFNSTKTGLLKNNNSKDIPVSQRGISWRGS